MKSKYTVYLINGSVDTHEIKDGATGWFCDMKMRDTYVEFRYTFHESTKRVERYPLSNVLKIVEAEQTPAPYVMPISN